MSMQLTSGKADNQLKSFDSESVRSLWWQTSYSVLFVNSILTKVQWGKYQYALGTNTVQFPNSLDHLLLSKGISQTLPLLVPCWSPGLALPVDWSPHHACWTLSSLTPFSFHVGIKCHTADHWIWTPEYSPRGWMMQPWSWGEAIANEVNLDQQETRNRKELNKQPPSFLLSVNGSEMWFLIRNSVANSPVEQLVKQQPA